MRSVAAISASWSRNIAFALTVALAHFARGTLQHDSRDFATFVFDVNNLRLNCTFHATSSYIRTFAVILLGWTYEPSFSWSPTPAAQAVSPYFRRLGLLALAPFSRVDSDLVRDNPQYCS